MGAADSGARPVRRQLPRSVQEEAGSFGQFTCPHFRQEHALSPFFRGSKSEVSDGVVRIHSATDLTNLVLGCYEQLDNIPEILETLIQVNFTEDNGLISALNDDVSNYITFANLRTYMMSALQQFGTAYFTPWREKPARGQESNMSIGTIVELLGTALNGASSAKREPALKRLAKYYSTATPASCFPPPTPNFLPKAGGHTEMINARYVLPHGIASNGQFLFILCGDGWLQICPLMNMGSMLSAISRQLPVQYGYKVSLIATKTEISIFSNAYCHEYRIADLLAKTGTYIPRNVIAGFVCYVTDGVIVARIDADFTVQVMKDGKMIRKVKLTSGNSEWNPAVPQLLPSIDYSYIPIQTNGAFIGFIFRTSPVSSVFRVFSLITGQHVYDEVFACAEAYYATMTDSFNRCHWVVCLLENNRLGVRRMYFAGSIDPCILDLDEKVKSKRSKGLMKALNSMNAMMLHYVGTQVVPKSYLTESQDHIVALVELAKAQSAADGEPVARQIIVILIEMTLRMLSPSALMRDLLLDLIDVLPLNLGAFLFFQSLRFVMYGETERGIDTMVHLFKKLSKGRIIAYALAKVECHNSVANIPFWKPNSFNGLIPEGTTQEDEVPQAVQSLLLVHQRLLISSAFHFLKSSTEIQYLAGQSSTGTSLDCLFHYATHLVGKFIAAMDTCQGFEAFEGSLILRLMFNFLNLVSSICQYHIVAQILTKLFSGLLDKINVFVNNKSLVVADDTYLSMIVRMFLFLYGKLAATLLQGTTLSDFERRFEWLISANLELGDSPELLSKEVRVFADDRMNRFVQNNDCEQMNKIYRVWKAAMNKRLADDIKRIDRLSILTFCGHLRLLDELFNPGNPLSPKMKLCLDQMLRIRNEYRNRLQKKEGSEGVVHRIVMLQRLKTSSFITAKEMADFICSAEEPEEVVAQIKQQKVRAGLTEFSFKVVGSVLSARSNAVIVNIFAFALAQIKSFSGLASVLKITNVLGKKAECSTRMFERFLHIIKHNPNSKLTLVSFRFFRDCELTETRKEFVDGVVKILADKKRGEDRALFSIGLLLIKSLDELPPSIASDFCQSSMGWLLTSVALENIQADEEFYRGFRKVFWTVGNNKERILCRVMFRVLNSTKLSEEIVRHELKQIVKKIGKNFISFYEQGLVTANEMVWMLRRILVEKTHAQPILMSILMNIPRDDQVVVTGLFAVLGGTLECVRPYCNIKYHADRSTTQDFIAVPTTDQKTQFICYSRPFILNQPAQVVCVDRQTLAYAVPVVSLTPESFGDFDFILSFFDKCFYDLASVTSVLYVQVLSHFLAFPEFSEKITSEMTTALWRSPLPFHTIHDTLGVAKQLLLLQNVPRVCGFDVISFAGTPTVSYLSRQLKSGAMVKVRYSINGRNPMGYFGIVSDPVERFFTRYSLVAVPSGVAYPLSLRMEPFVDPFHVEFEVDMPKMQVRYGRSVLQFPFGKKFKIIIALPREVAVNIEIVECNDAFEQRSVPSLVDHGATQITNSVNLFRMPDIVSRYERLPPLAEFPVITVLMDPIPVEQKIQYNFIEPPSVLSIHPGFATHASSEIIATEMAGLFETLALQFATVCLMRIIRQRPELTLNPTKLFTMMVVALEPFSSSSFAAREFPFSLTTPVWENSNFLYCSLENEAKDCIQKILSVESFRVRIATDTFKMCESKRMHLLAYPHLSHVYMPPYAVQQRIRIKNRFSIVTLNSFAPLRALMVNGRQDRLPLVVSDGPTEKVFSSDILGSEMSILYVSGSDNSFAFDTAFEALLVMKNLLFVAKTPRERFTLKSALVDLFVAQSPFVFPYLSQFFDFIALQIPATPHDNSRTYINRLVVMGSFVKSGYYSARFTNFLTQEGRVLNNPRVAELSKHFPEFLNIKPDPPESNICKLDVISPDPGTIKYEFNERISTFKLFTKQYRSLVGFPFWDILPYWLRVSSAWRINSSSGDNGDIDPFWEKTSSDIVHISNPGSHRVGFRLHHAALHKFPANTMLLVSTTPTFENTDFLAGHLIEETIEVEPRSHTFLSLLDLPGGWTSVRIEFTNYKEYRPPPPENLDMALIHDAFVEDMKQFAVKWSEADTEELIMLIPRYAFREPTFSTVEAIAKSSNLCQKFSATVVLLRAMILHHFNYIRWKHYSEVTTALWENMATFVSCEDAADYVSSQIYVNPNDLFATFTIDRHAAQRLVVAGGGDASKSIVSQLTQAFKKYPTYSFQCKKRPWKIKFAGELAIDAGGPTRELVTEVAASIFEPTTQLMIPVPNGRRQIGQNKDTFIPFDRTMQRAEEYKTIGHYLGIVLRTGLSQYLPFAPIVWRYLGNDKIGTEDVLAIDDALRDQFKHMREEEKNEDFEERAMVQWKIEHWDGTVITLPGHSPGTYVKANEVEQFIRECIQFRIGSIKPTLKLMRTAFRENVGFKKHNLLTGALLSRMAQGSSIILPEHLKSITVYTDYEGAADPVIMRFWRSVDRLSSEQMKLLLRFITTLTRLPNASINPDFRIQIDQMNSKSPDESLPTASTCFNRLHLPRYSDDEICYQKLLYAIQFCQTMENK